LCAIYGPPPPGCPMVVHMCGCHDCLNPNHMVWGSMADNRVPTNPMDFSDFEDLLESQGRAL
jgi:hypothetical protein